MELLDALYDDAEENGVAVYAFPLGSIPSMIVSEQGNTAIGLNPERITTSAEELCCLGHELGHFHTGSYYTLSSPPEQRSKAEYRADTWMVMRLIPPDRLKEAIGRGLTEPWQLAELFGVTEDVVRRASYIYRCKEIL